MIFLAFLFPLTLYCLGLAFVNRRQTPLLVSGPWDFVGVLFAASGFLLFGGPAVLSGLNERWRLLWVLGSSRDLVEISSEGWLFWILASALYFLVVVLIAAVVLWSRRRMTSIYNVDPPAADRALCRVLDNRRLSWQRSGNRLLIQPDAPSSNPTAAVEVKLDPFPVMYHVTLTWTPPRSDLRQEVEADLARTLLEVQTPDHAVGGWFLALGGFFFCLMFGILLVLVAATLFLRR